MHDKCTLLLFLKDFCLLLPLYHQSDVYKLLNYGTEENQMQTTVPGRVDGRGEGGPVQEMILNLYPPSSYLFEVGVLW